jgi:hypothetical protein
MKPISCPNCNTLSGIGFATQEDAMKVTACVRDLYETMQDLMPQMGKMVLQDYEKLNRGLMAAREILGENSPKNSSATGKTSSPPNPTTSPTRNPWSS